MNEHTHPIVLAIDAVGAKHSGAATVLCSIVDAALRSSDVGRVVLFASPRATWRFQLPDSRRLVVEERRLEESSPFARIIWFELGLANAVRRHGADVLLTLSSGGRPPPGIPAVAFLQQPLPFAPDCRHLHSISARATIAVLGVTIGRSAHASTRVVTQTRAFLESVVSAYSLPPGKAVVIPPSAPVLPAAPEGFPRSIASFANIPKAQRLLYVGSNAAHKNVSIAVDGVRELVRSCHPVKLFVTFARPKHAPNEPSVEYLGPLSREELASAYANAGLLVMPSLAETLGLPLLEAMAAGLPILAADRPYAREVTAGHAVYFDPLDVHAFVKGYLDIAGQDELQRNERLAAGRRVIEELARSAPYEKLVSLVASCVSGRPGHST